MVKINELQLENVKRIKAVEIHPNEKGLTVVGGRNNQGKTSVLDSIAWVLGGDRYKPSQAARDGSAIPPSLCIKLSNGLIVERKGKNSALKVTDPNGKKGGQQLLNEFIEALALDLPKFMSSTSKEKANILLKIIGVGDKLFELDRQEQEAYNKRHAIGQIADQKTKYAQEMESYPGVPDEPVSITELIRQQQDILLKNSENQKKRDAVEAYKAEVERYTKIITETQEKLNRALSDLETAKKSAVDLHDESTAELEKNIADIENINIKVRANLDREKAFEDAAHYKDQYDELTAEINNIRNKRTALLNNADLPLEGLSVSNGELLYNGHSWDNMSSSEQLKVSTAIVRRLNPECGFVLIDKLEQMDIGTLNEFGAWLEAENLQAIATRVSTGRECSIIIEDGYGHINTEPVPEKKKIWKAGEF